LDEQEEGVEKAENSGNDAELLIALRGARARKQRDLHRCVKVQE